MPLVSSQGTAFAGLSAKKLTIKKARASTGSNKLDASTLSIAHGGERVYEDGLVDNGQNPSTGGIITTAAVDFFGAGPATGSTASWGGVTLKCTETEEANAAGELVSGTAQYTSDYSA